MDSFFSPAGCAVVGASRDPHKPGHQMLRSMLDAGFPPERIFPVNPGLTGSGRLSRGPGAGDDEIAGLPAYASLASIPGPVQLAVIMVPPRALDDVLADVARRTRERGDLGALIVTAGGYAELGTAEGRQRQDKLARAAREAGVRLMGPNCIGVIDTRSRLDTTFLHGVVRRPGPIGFVSQSGALGAWFLQMLSSEPEPVGFSKFVSLGNTADVTMAETLDYLRTDPDTRVVGIYLEGTANPRPLLEAIAALSADKPVVVLKTGRTESGRAAAASHTGALAGTDRIWEGALRQAGALRVERMDEFVDTLRVLAGWACAGARPARLPIRVFLVTHAGGPGVYTMDLLAAHPGRLAPAVVTPETKAALAAAVPPMSSVCRPDGHIDMTASATPAQHAEVVKLLLADPGVDALMTLDLPIRFLGEDAVAAALAAAWREAAGRLGSDARPGAAPGGIPGVAATGAKADKTFLPVLMHGKWSEAGRRVLETSGLCALATPDRAVAALGNLARLAEIRERADPKALAVAAPGVAAAGDWVPADPDGLAVSAVPAFPAQETEVAYTLNEAESATVLAACGVEFAPWRLARSKDEAVAAAGELGFPVVLKLCSRAIPHKAAAGAVRLGLGTPDGVSQAYDELAGRAVKIFGPSGGGLGEGDARRDGASAGRPGRAPLPDELDGFLVQAQAAAGAEVLIGGLRDPLFGPVVAVGAGGTRVGVDSPLLFRLAPLTAAGAQGLAEDLADALRKLPIDSAGSTRTGGRLRADGLAATLDLPGLAAAIVGLSQLMVSRPGVLEADLNPVIVYPPGRGVVAVDALVRLRYLSSGSGTGRRGGP